MSLLVCSLNVICLLFLKKCFLLDALWASYVLVWWLSLFLENFYPLVISSVPLSLSSLSAITISQILPFWNCPICLKCSVLVFHSFTSLNFSLGSFYWPVFKLILFLAVLSLLICPLKAFFISITVFLVSSIYFLLFLRISISLLILSVLICCLLFPLKPLA